MSTAFRGGMATLLGTDSLCVPFPLDFHVILEQLHHNRPFVPNDHSHNSSIDCSSLGHAISAHGTWMGGKPWVRTCFTYWQSPIAAVAFTYNQHHNMSCKKHVANRITYWQLKLAISSLT